MTDSLLHMGDWSVHNMDEYALQGMEGEERGRNGEGWGRMEKEGGMERLGMCSLGLWCSLPHVVVVVGGGCECLLMVVGIGSYWQDWWHGSVGLFSMMVVVCGSSGHFSLWMVVVCHCRWSLWVSLRSLCGWSWSVIMCVDGGGEKSSHNQTLLVIDHK